MAGYCRAFVAGKATIKVSTVFLPRRLLLEVLGNGKAVCFGFRGCLDAVQCVKCGVDKLIGQFMHLASSGLKGHWTSCRRPDRLCGLASPTKAVYSRWYCGLFHSTFISEGLEVHLCPRCKSMVFAPDLNTGVDDVLHRSSAFFKPAKSPENLGEASDASNINFPLLFLRQGLGLSHGGIQCL